MAAGDIWQVTMVYKVGGEPCANVMYIKAVDDSGTTDATADAETAFAGAPQTQLLLAQCDTVAHEANIMRQVYPTTKPARVFSSSKTGNEAAVALPANQAITLSHYAGIGDKRRRGRLFISGFGEAWVNAGRVEAAHESKFDNFITQMTSLITSSGRTYQMQHFSKKNAAYYDIDSMVVRPVPTKIRNRTPRITSIS